MNSQKKYKKRYGKKDKRGRIPNRASIEQRPLVVNNKRLGSNLIIEKDHKGTIMTMVERQTGCILMAKQMEKKPVMSQKK